MTHYYLIFLDHTMHKHILKNSLKDVKLHKIVFLKDLWKWESKLYVLVKSTIKNITNLMVKILKEDFTSSVLEISSFTITILSMNVQLPSLQESMKQIAWTGSLINKELMELNGTIVIKCYMEKTNLYLMLLTYKRSDLISVSLFHAQEILKDMKCSTVS